jgi:hypothetical protein
MRVQAITQLLFPRQMIALLRSILWAKRSPAGLPSISHLSQRLMAKRPIRVQDFEALPTKIYRCSPA